MAEIPDVIVGCTPVHIGVPPGEFPLTLRLQDCDAILAALEAALNKGIEFGPGIPRRIVEEAGRRIEAAAERERQGISEAARLGGQLGQTEREQLEAMAQQFERKGNAASANGLKSEARRWYVIADAMREQLPVAPQDDSQTASQSEGV